MKYYRIINGPIAAILNWYNTHNFLSLSLLQGNDDTAGNNAENTHQGKQVRKGIAEEHSKDQGENNIAVTNG